MGGKIGEGSLRQWLARGHSEIGQALPAFKDSIQATDIPKGPEKETIREIYIESDASDQKSQSAEPDMEL